MFLLVGLVDGQTNDEGGALAELAGGGDGAAVAVGDAAADGQADPGAFIFVAAVQALEDGKDFFQIFLLEPDAVVLDGDLALFGAGIVGVRIFAKFEKRVDGMMLPGNGWPVCGSRTGVTSVEKFPDRKAWLGTLPRNGCP